MRKIKLALFIIIAALAALLCIPACNLFGGGKSGGEVSGCFVRQVEAGAEDGYDYFVLDGKTSAWYNDRQESGTFTLNGGELTFKLESGDTYADARYDKGEDNYDASISFTKEGEIFRYVFFQSEAEPPKNHYSGSTCRAYFTAEGATGFTDYKVLTAGVEQTLPVPFKQGYIFKHWYEEATNKVYHVKTVLPHRPVRLTGVFESLPASETAKFTDEYVTIDFNGLDRTVSDCSADAEQYKELGAYFYYNQFYRLEFTGRELDGEAIGVEGGIDARELLNKIGVTANTGYTATLNNLKNTVNFGSNLVSLRVASDERSSYYLFDVYVKRDFKVKIYDGGAVIKSDDPDDYIELYVTEGDKLNAEDIPEIEGFTLDRLMYADVYKAYDFDAEVTADLNLYRKYQPVKFELELSGGECGYTLEMEPYMEVPYFSNTYSTPVREGYEFIGWYSDGKLRISNDCKTVFFKLTKKTNTATLTAQWQPTLFVKSSETVGLEDEVKYERLTRIVSYKTNGYHEDGSIKAAPEYTFYKLYSYSSGKIDIESVDTVVYGSTQKLTSQSAEYAFSWLGWFNGASRLDQGAQYADYTAEIKQDITYTAKWTYYTVNLSSNAEGRGRAELAGGKTPVRGGFTASLEEGSYGVEEGGTATLSATSYLGYDFAGWYKGSTKLSDNPTYQLTMQAGNLDVQAHWQKQPALANFNYTSTETTCTLDGVENKSVTTLTVPDIFTGYSQGALNGLNSLATLTLHTLDADLGTLFTAKPISLSKVVITDSFTGSIQDFTHLTEVTLPTNLSALPQNAFKGCSALETVSIPSGVTSIGANAFRGTGIASLVLPAGLSELGTRALAGMPLVNFSIPSTVTKIGGYAFENCDRLESLVIPSTVTEIGGYAFSGCSSMPTVTLPSSFTTITGGLFGGYTGLTTFTVSDGVTTIADEAFMNCANLESVTVSKTVETLGARAFSGCSKLATVNFEKNSQTGKAALHTVGNNAFAGTNITAITFPACTELLLGEGLFTGGKLESVTFAMGLAAVGKNAFKQLSTLKTVTFTSSLPAVGESAFESCTSLTTVNASSGIYEIGRRAFYGCGKLTTINLSSVTDIFESGLENTAIGDTGFGNLRYLGVKALYGTNIKNITMTNIQTIEPNALPSITTAVLSTGSGHHFKVTDPATNKSPSALTNGLWEIRYPSSSASESDRQLLYSQNANVLKTYSSYRHTRYD